MPTNILIGNIIEEKLQSSKKETDLAIPIVFSNFISMTHYLHSFINLFFLSFIALFPVVNPIGSAFIVNPYFSGLASKERIRAVKRITFYAFSICVVTMFVGHWILELFGLSIPVVRLGGGIMICKMGWEFLSTDKSSDDEAPDQAAQSKAKNISDKLFYPITFPVTTGAGTISVLFALSAHAENENLKQYLFNTGALLASILAMCVLIFLFYINASRLISFVGSQNQNIINRLMAFLIFCVGLQIAIAGITELIKG